MRQSKLILFTSLLLISMLTHAETDNHFSNRKNIGFGLGAFIEGADCMTTQCNHRYSSMVHA